MGDETHSENGPDATHDPTASSATTHEGREDVIALLDRLAGVGWRAGNPLADAGANP